MLIIFIIILVLVFFLIYFPRWNKDSRKENLDIFIENIPIDWLSATEKIKELKKLRKI
jgi:hypothetical protein